MLFRVLIAADADASAKADRFKKAPLDLGRKMLCDDLESGRLARAEHESIRAEVVSQAPRGAPDVASANQVSAEKLRPRKNCL